MQIGVVPIVAGKDKLLIVLVTSRGKGQWLMPKGNTHRKFTKREMALTEAYEEAGILGVIRHKHYVDVPYRKEGRDMVLRLYPMSVKRILNDWPEKDSRERKIVRAKQAKKLLRCKKMRAGLERLVELAAA